MTTEIIQDEFKNLFETQYAKFNIKTGTVVDGLVVGVVKNLAIVNIGFKSEGYVPLEEFRNLDAEIQVQIGDKVRVAVESLEDEAGNVVLSKEHADAIEAWNTVESVFQNDGAIEGLVVNKVKGGLSVNLGGIKAFLPGSQIDLKPIKSLDKLIGHKYKFKILKLNQAKGNIVLSRRAIMEVERESLRRDVLENISEGQIIRGTVKNLTDYGVFVDLGGIDGLLHITDLTWGRVGHPSELLKVNDEIDVVVLKYDPKNEKVSLGFKQLSEDPWTKIEGKYHVSEKIKGKVVSITDYGVFVELEPGVEGLVHVSELSWSKKVKHPSKIVKTGDEVEAMILDVDLHNRKIALGLKQLEPNPWDILNQKYPVGSTIKGKVRNLTDFGIFVGVEDEAVDGLVHVSDISWNKEYKWPNEDFKKGQDVDVVVLNIDKENKKFSLGIKQLSDDPFAVMMRKYPLGKQIIGKVEKSDDKAVYLRVDENTVAFLPLSETGIARGDAKGQFADGAEVEAQVKKYEERDRRMVVSIKMLSRRQEKENMRDFMDKQGDASVTFGDILEKQST